MSLLDLTYALLSYEWSREDGAGDVFGIFRVFIVMAVEPVGFVFFKSRDQGW